MFVSIIVPCYNHAPYLQERLDSIINQSYKNFEVILLDDCSSDNSDTLLRNYKNYPQVSHCIINEKNSGSTFCQWNKGIELAKGELIWIAESDDVAHLQFLEKLVPAFDQNSNLVLAYCQSYRMSAQGKVTGSWKECTDNLDAELFNQNFQMSGLEYFARFLNFKNTIPNASGVIFKKEAYLNVGGATPELRFIGDWEIWTKISSQGDIFFEHTCLNYFRYHDTSVIAKARKKKDHFEVRRQVITFRENIDRFLKNQATNNIWNTRACLENHKLLIKAIRKNASLAIRRRYYKKIIPTASAALKTLPIYLIPLFVIKLITQLIISILLVAPYKLMFK